MDPGVLAAILGASISVLGSVIVVTVSSYLTRRAELEADWRTQQLEHYRKLLIAISGLAGRGMSPMALEEAERAFADAFNTIALVAPADVLHAVQQMQEQMSVRNPNRSDAAHDEALNRLVRSIRVDLGVPKALIPANLKIWLYAGLPAKD